jgi:hypothetical protein
VTATKGASGRIGTVLDDLVAQVMLGFHAAIESKIEGIANDVKRAIGAPLTGGSRRNFNMNTNGDSESARAARAD